MKQKNKFFSFMMALVMMLSSFVSFAHPMTIYANPLEVPIGTVSLNSTKKIGALMTFIPAPSAQDFDFEYIAYIKDGREWPAYCVQPNRPGVSGNWIYQVNASTLLEDAQVHAAIANGHPFKTPQEMGVNDKYEAYYTTKMAIWSLVHDNYSNPANFKANGPDHEHVYQAYLKLLEKAKASTGISTIRLAAEWQSIRDDINNQIHTYKVISNNNDYNGNYEVSMLGEIPSGTRIEKNGNTFDVIIPINSIPINFDGSFELQIKAASGNGNALVYSGIPTTQANTRQSYALAYESDLTGSGTVNYKRDTFFDDPGDGQLRIVKLAAGTQTPLAGAEIKLTKADGGVYGIKSTGSNGEVFFDNLPHGTYYVEEVTPPRGYLLDVNRHKDIVIIADKTQQTVVFVNEETPKLRIMKVDADTSRPISGAVFEISLDSGTEKYTAVTDSSGNATLGNTNILKPGTYKVREIAVPEPYFVDEESAEQYVKLEPGKTTSVTFKNQKKPTWTITKYIEGTDIGKVDMNTLTLALDKKSELSIEPEDMELDDSAFFISEADETIDDIPSETPMPTETLEPTPPIEPAEAIEHAEATEPTETEEPPAIAYYAKWTDAYKQARRFLYGKGVPQDYEKAHELFISEAEKGNALALYDIGRMHLTGLHAEVNEVKAQEWFAKSHAAFSYVESKAHHDYIQYRLGKLFAWGHGVEKDYFMAAQWFEKSADQRNQFAAYSLGNLYYYGNGVDQSYETAFDLYSQAYEQYNAFAAYELGKMYRDGIGTEDDLPESKECFAAAYSGFVKIEREIGGDQLQHRLGQMLLAGEGTEVNIPKAVEYFEKAIKLGNVYSMNALVKLHMEGKSDAVDIKNIIEKLTKAAETENDFAQFALGRYYAFDKTGRDIEIALQWLTKSAEQGNEYAAKLIVYLNTTDTFKRFAAPMQKLLQIDAFCPVYLFIGISVTHNIHPLTPLPLQVRLRWLLGQNLIHRNRQGWYSDNR